MIIDASIAVKWLTNEEGADVARALIGQGELRVPSLFHVEVANAIWKKALRGEVVPDEILPNLASLSDLVMTIDDTQLVGRAVEIGLALSHPVYDSIYLALAEATDDVIVTDDRRFLKASAGSAFSSRVRPLQ